MPVTTATSWRCTVTKMKKTVAEFVELITHVSLRGMGFSAAETLVDGHGEKENVPDKQWLVLAWSAQDIGYGEASFSFSKDGIVCDDERMGATFIEALLVKVARTAKMTEK